MQAPLCRLLERPEHDAAGGRAPAAAPASTSLAKKAFCMVSTQPRWQGTSPSAAVQPGCRCPSDKSPNGRQLSLSNSTFLTADFQLHLSGSTSGWSLSLCCSMSPCWTPLPPSVSVPSTGKAAATSLRQVCPLTATCNSPKRKHLNLCSSITSTKMTKDCAWQGH